MKDKAIKQIADILAMINGVLSLVSDHIRQQNKINRTQADVLEELDKRLTKLEKKVKK